MMNKANIQRLKKHGWEVGSAGDFLGLTKEEEARIEPSCSICRRNAPDEYTEKHHLVPKSRKGKKTIIVCHDCGNQIHKIFSNKELEKQYNSLESILANEEIQKWIKWIQKKKRFGFCMKSKKKRT